ncbi:unnamed protein product [Moneuplotes crassus]|uniref:Uncharacterized protein n=1 Tax=Euplotes crassus TaxID=5936 RepID=A0AAD1UEZ2_EUPCR|nr:unnamed protein product [Moneuplotes crassus]
MRRYKVLEKIGEPQSTQKCHRIEVSMLLYSKQFGFLESFKNMIEYEKLDPMEGNRVCTVFKNQMVTLIILLSFCCQAFAFYPSQCKDGYFGESENCVPCDSSCKTCSDGTTCETCEDFMRYNSTTKLCESCAEDEYYDPVKGDCSSCNNVCIQACAYQASCFECPPNEIFDIETFECVQSCASDKYEIQSEKMNIGKICKTLKIYVDPESQKLIELGTYEYPYRTFKSAASEILNHYSNTEAEVEIYMKDGYIEMDNFYFINMTSVKITAHPDYELLNKRAQISFNSRTQPGISKKARFHLLKNISIKQDDFVIKEGINEREISELSKRKMGFMLAWTSFEISEVEFHSTELDFFCVTIYFQEKLLKLYNMDFNVTGESFEINDPMNVHLENITVDVSIEGRFFYPLIVFCNYPEANTKNNVYIKSVNPKVSLEKLDYTYTFLNSYLPGNHTMIDIDCGSLPVNERLHVCIVVGVSSTCLPDDGLLQTVEYDSIHSNGQSQPYGNLNILLSPIVSFAVPYRPVYVGMRNFDFVNITQDWNFGLFYLYTIGVEQSEMINFSFRNVLTKTFLMEILTIKDLKIKNLTFEDSLNHQFEIIKITATGDIEMEDVILRNFNNIGAYNAPLFSLSFPNTSSIILKDLSFQNLELAAVPLFYITTPPVMMTVKNFMFKDCNTSEGQSLLNFLYINSISISNVTLENVNPINSFGSAEKIIRIGSLNYEEMQIAEISDISIMNSSMSLFGVGTISSISNYDRNITFNNIKYSGCTFPSPRALVSTDRFVGSLNLHIQFSQLTFENVKFVTSGVLIELKHQLPTAVHFIECSISGANSGSIEAEGRKISNDLDTKFKFMNSTFSNVTLSSTPFISTSQNLVYEIQNSSFTEFTSLGLIAGIFRASDRSVITIEDSVFQNNSAVLSTIFKAETEASIICTNCTISNNFGVTNGVFEIESGAVLKILQSAIYENYAIQYPVGAFLSAFTPSIISNTQIYSNNAIFEPDVAVELSSSCIRLCFLNDLIKSYLANFEFSTITQTDTLIQVLLAEVHIINNTQIYNSTSAVYSFSSVLIMEDSFLFGIDFTNSPINLVSTEATLNNLTIADCTKLPSQDEHAFIQVTSGTLISSGLKVSSTNFRISQLSFSSCMMNNTQFTDVINDNGLIGCLKCQNFELDTLLLENSYSTSFPLLFLQETFNVELKNIKLSGYQYPLAQFSSSSVTLIQNLEVNGGKQALEFIDSNLLKMKNCSFSNNEETGASRSGAIQILNSKINIEDTIFRNNSADSGGAITFECTSMANCELNIENSKFLENSARLSGGAIYYNYNYPRIKNTAFSNNSANYGPNFASYPAKIELTDSSQGNDIILENVGSGITIDQTLTLAIYDIDNQIMNLDNSSQIVILSRNASEANTKGFNILSVNQGIAQFDNFAAIIRDNKRSSNFTLSSKSINTDKVQEVLGSLFSQKDLQINFRDCQPGERIVGDECEVCAIGTYSLEWNAIECVDCDLEADCLGGNQVSVKSGYWRRFQNSTKIVECIVEEACEGGFLDVEDDNQTYNSKNIHPVNCAEGYSGNLCSQCVVTQDVKYERINDYECQKCPEQIWNAIQVVFTLLLVLLFYITLVVINVRKTDESELSVLLRILTNYLQIITVSASMTNDYPAGLIALTIPIRLFGGSTDALLSFDCFIKDTEVNFMFNSNSIFKLFLMTFLPIILFFIIAVMWLIIKWVKPAWCTNIKRALVISFITVVFVLHPKLTEKSISLFKCIEIDEGYKVARIDTNLECFSPTHLKWCIIVGIPIILVWVIACPLITYLVILKQRKKKDNRMMGYFLIIYQGLKPEVIYWEFVNTMRKVAILLFLLFELKVAINLSLIVLLLTARIQIKIKPYKNFENNKIEFLSTMGGATLTMGALVYSRHEQHDVLNGFVFLSIAIVNCKFLIEWLILLMQLYQGKNKFAQTTVICLSKIMCKKRPRLEKVEKKDQSKIKSLQKEIQENKSESGYVKKRVYRKSKSIIKRGKFKKTRSRKKMWKTKSVRPRDFEVDEQGTKPLMLMFIAHCKSAGFKHYCIVDENTNLVTSEIEYQICGASNKFFDYFSIFKSFVIDKSHITSKAWTCIRYCPN